MLLFWKHITAYCRCLCSYERVKFICTNEISVVSLNWLNIMSLYENYRTSVSQVFVLICIDSLEVGTKL